MVNLYSLIYTDSNNTHTHILSLFLSLNSTVYIKDDDTTARFYKLSTTGVL